VVSLSTVTNPSPAAGYTPVARVDITSAGGAVLETTSSSPSVTTIPQTAQCAVSFGSLVAYSRGQLALTYSSGFIQGSTNTTYELTLSLPNSYPDDSTNQALAPTFLPNASAATDLGTTSLYTLPYATALTVTMLMPPSNQPQPNLLTLTAVQGTASVDGCSVSLSGVQPSSFSSFTISPGTVQTTSSLSFSLVLLTPLIPHDEVHLTFSGAFSLAGVSDGPVAVSSFNDFSLTKNGGSLLVLRTNLSSATLYATLAFSIAGVGLPFSTALATVEASLLTSTGYYRASQSRSYSAAAGVLSGAASCLSLEVGVSTSCLFSVSPSSSLSSDAVVEIVLNSNFPLGTGFFSCGVAGAGLAATASCNSLAANSTIRVSSLNASAANLAAQPFAINVTNFTMSRAIGAQTLTLNTYSGGYLVDSGTLQLVAAARQLTAAQLKLSSSSIQTYSPTDYTLEMALPFDPGYTFDLALQLPVPVQAGFTQPSLTNATLGSYAGGTIAFSKAGLSNASIGIGQLMTPLSTAPLAASLNISYNGSLMFYGS
jgi:hypothetical protein